MYLNEACEIIKGKNPLAFCFVMGKENCSLKEKLQRIKPGLEQYQQYEDVCVEILKYVLGDYLTLWNVQEKTNNGMYRFDFTA